ncbi:MAG: response regulator [Anaerolineales bacterium]|nr:response regulator [Anaerolineales bacterium]
MLARRVAEQTADLRAANEELARAARYKDEFLAAMSHELRTPLNTIIGMSDVMLEGVYGVLNEKQHRAMANLQDSGYHLLALINDILDVAKLAAGQMRLHREAIDVDSLCNSCLAMVKKAADDKRVALVYTRDERIERMVADLRRMRQIIVNLLSNAVKYTNEEGSIGLEVRCNEEGDTVIITVWDTGIGIAPDDMKRLFKPFVQVDSSLTRRYEGTGLGLTIVQSLAALHGGSVRLESEVGAGSRFVVAVPWIHPPGEVASKSWNPDGDSDFANSVRTDSPLLLVAEDNESSIEMLTGYFELAGYRVQVARNGLAAVQLAASLKPDVIVMDIQMPELDGHQAMQRIRREDTSRRVPIIAVTALAMPGDAERSRAAGADEYLTKPVSLRLLRKHIEHLLTLATTTTRDQVI